MTEQKWRRFVLFLGSIGLLIGVLLIWNLDVVDAGLVSASGTPPVSKTPALVLPDLQDLGYADGDQAPLLTSPTTKLGTMHVVTFTAFADTMISQGYPTSNCADDLTLRVGYDTYLEPDARTTLSLIKFYLASIPETAVVHQATLYLYQAGYYDYEGHVVDFTPYRLSEPWSVDTVTWENRPNYAEAYPSTSINSSIFDWHAFNLTTLVTHWVAGTYPNEGVLMKAPDLFDGWRIFAASETIYPPQLVVRYEDDPDFSLTVVPDHWTAISGENLTSNLYVTALRDFDDDVTLEAGGLPLNTTVDFVASPVIPTTHTLLMLTTAANTPGGNYTLVVTGTAGNLVRTEQVTLDITQPDFLLDVSPTTQSVWSGQEAAYTLALTATAGFTKEVMLSAEGYPPGGIVNWQKNPVVPTGSTVLTLSTQPDTPGGVYTMTVTGTADSLIHAVQVFLEVIEPDFEMTLMPSYVSVGFGQVATYTVSLSAVGGFSEDVTLNVMGLAPNTTHTWLTDFGPSSSGTLLISPTETANLVVTTTLDTPAGTHPFTVVGTAGAREHIAHGTLHVSAPDFMLDVDPDVRNVKQAASTAYTVNLTALGGFADGVTLNVAGLPPDSMALWGMNPLTPSASTQLTVVTMADTPVDQYLLTVTATHNSLVHSTQVTLSVEAGESFVYLPLVLKSGVAGATMHVAGQGYFPGLPLMPLPSSTKAVDRIALVVGVADYEHLPPPGTMRIPQVDKTTDLAFAGAYDVEDISDVFEEYGVETAYVTREASDGMTIITLVDSQATKGAIHAAIVNVIDPLEDADTVVIITFSGHGMYAPDDDGDDGDGYDEFIVPYDIDIENDVWNVGMAIRDDELDAWLDALESQHIVLAVDSCFSGGMMDLSLTDRARGVRWAPVPDTLPTAPQWQDSFMRDVEAPGRVIIAATLEDQASWEFGELQNGVFTYYLVEALRTGSADTSGDGWVSAEEAYAYLSPRVDNYVWTHAGEHQNPQMSDGVGGEVNLTYPPGTLPLACPAWP